MSMPRIFSACWAASSGDLAIFTPPALPRPPIFTWALTATTEVPSSAAAWDACSGFSATIPRSTGTPCFSNKSRAWYSYRSTISPLCEVAHRSPVGLCRTTGTVQQVVVRRLAVAYRHREQTCILVPEFPDVRVAHRQSLPPAVNPYVDPCGDHLIHLTPCEPPEGTLRPSIKECPARHVPPVGRSDRSHCGLS